VPDVSELAPAGPAAPGGVLARPGLDAGLLIDAEQRRAGRRDARYGSQIALGLAKKARP